MALRAGDAAVTTHLLSTTADKNILAFIRKNGSSEVMVLINFSKEKINFNITDTNLTGKYKNVFNKEEKDFTTVKSFEMQPWGYEVFEK